MNKQIASGKWNEFKGEMRKLWGDLTDNDLDRTHGNVEAIGGILTQKYGGLKDDAKAGFDALVERFGQDAAHTSEVAKENMRETKAPKH